MTRGVKGSQEVCLFEGCDRLASARGYCGMHYRRLLKYGDAHSLCYIRGDDLARFRSHVAEGPAPAARPDLGECWLWTGVLLRGYGQVRFRGKGTGAHRMAYELLVGPIPSGLQIDHLCRVRNCVRPTHLEPVTHRTNVLRSDCWSGVNARKTHCKRGHPFDGTNTIVLPNGQRKCRICQRAAERAYKKRKRDEAREHQLAVRGRYGRTV